MLDQPCRLDEQVLRDLLRFLLPFSIRAAHSVNAQRSYNLHFVGSESTVRKQHSVTTVHVAVDNCWACKLGQSFTCRCFDAAKQRLVKGSHKPNILYASSATCHTRSSIKPNLSHQIKPNLSHQNQPVTKHATCGNTCSLVYSKATSGVHEHSQNCSRYTVHQHATQHVHMVHEHSKIPPPKNTAADQQVYDISGPY